MTIPDSLLSLEWVKINLYIYIRRKAGKAGACDISMSELSHELGITRATASRYIHQLSEMSYIYINGHQTDTKRTLISFTPNELTSTRGHQTDTKRTLEQRKNEFTETLKPFVEKYGREMLNEFWSYWTEPNKSKSKMRFEMEKAWSLERRLVTWNTRNKKYGNHKQTAEERQQADLAAAAKTYMRLDEERRANLGGGNTEITW